MIDLTDVLDRNHFDTVSGSVSGQMSGVVFCHCGVRLSLCATSFQDFLTYFVGGSGGCAVGSHVSGVGSSSSGVCLCYRTTGFEYSSSSGFASSVSTSQQMLMGKRTNRRAILSNNVSSAGTDLSGNQYQCGASTVLDCGTCGMIATKGVGVALLARVGCYWCEGVAARATEGVQIARRAGSWGQGVTTRAALGKAVADSVRRVWVNSRRGRGRSWFACSGFGGWGRGGHGGRFRGGTCSGGFESWWERNRRRVEGRRFCGFVCRGNFWLQQFQLHHEFVVSHQSSLVETRMVATKQVDFARGAWSGSQGVPARSGQAWVWGSRGTTGVVVFTRAGSSRMAARQSIWNFRGSRPGVDVNSEEDSRGESRVHIFWGFEDLGEVLSQPPVSTLCQQASELLAPLGFFSVEVRQVLA